MYLSYFGILTPIIYIIAYVLRGFTYFPTLYFIIAAFLIMHPVVAFIAHLIAIVCSASLSHYIGIHLQDSFRRLRSFVDSKDIQEKIQKHGIKSIFFFHITGISLDIPNYLSGYLRIPYKSFMLTVILANIRTTTAFYLIITFMPHSLF